jgi:hypothetical protein
MEVNINSFENFFPKTSTGSLIESFENFVRERVAVSGTYLDRVPKRSTDTAPRTNPPFSGTNLTTGNTWDIKFEPRGTDSKGKSAFKVEFSEPIFTEISQAKGWRLEQVKAYLANVRIECEPVEKFHRTHFYPGLPEEMRGLGLGYIVYEAFIKYLGFASSKGDATNEASRIWQKLASDPDFYGISTPYEILLVWKEIFNGQGSEEMEKRKSQAIKALTLFFKASITKETFGDTLKSIDINRNDLKSVLDQLSEKKKFTIDLELFQDSPELVNIFFNHLDYIKNFDDYNRISDDAKSELTTIEKDKGLEAMMVRYNELMERLKDNSVALEEIKAIVKDAFTNSLKQLTTEFTKTYTSGDNGPEEAKTLCIDKLIPKEKEILSIIDKYKLDMQVTDKMKISYIYDSLYPAQEKNT